MSSPGAAATVMIPTPLREYASGKESVRLTVATVQEALERLTADHPGLKRHLFDDDGRLRRFVNIYLNDQDIRYLEDGDQTRLSEGDEIRIVPSIAGGTTVVELS